MRLLFLEDTSFIVLLLQTSCIEFAPARDSYANVSDDVETNQDYTNGEHSKTCLLSSSLAKVPTVLVLVFFYSLL